MEASLKDRVKAAKVRTEDHFDEGPRERRAFEAFFNEGVIRTEAAVAKIVGVNVDVIQGWRKSFDWDARIESIRNGKYKETLLSTNRDFLTSVEESLIIVGTLKDKFKTYVSGLKGSELAKAFKPRDVVEIMKAEATLLKIKTNYHETVHEAADTLRKEIAEMLNAGEPVSEMDTESIRKVLSTMINEQPGFTKQGLREAIKRVKPNVAG